MCFGPELLLLGKSECPILSLIGKIVQRGKVHFLFQYDCALVHKAWLDEFGEKEPHSSTNTEHTEQEERLQATNISLGRHKWPSV